MGSLGEFLLGALAPQLPPVFKKQIGFLKLFTDHPNLPSKKLISQVRAFSTQGA